MNYSQFFLDHTGKLETYIKAEEGVCALLMAGRGETTPARELHSVLLEAGIIGGGEKFEFIIDLSNVVYLASTALGLIGLISRDKKSSLALVGASKLTKKGLFSVGVFEGEEAEGVYFRDELEDSFEVVGGGANLQNVLLAASVSLSSAEEPEAREIEIVKSYLDEEQLKELDVHMATIKPFFKQARLANELVLPAKKTIAAAVYVFLQRHLTEFGLLESVGGKYTEDELEVIAKELTENTIDWGYPGRSGIIYVEAISGADALEIVFTDYGSGAARKSKLTSKVNFSGGKGLKRLRRLTGGNLILRSPAPRANAMLKAMFGEKYPLLISGPGTQVTLKFPIS